MSGVLLHGGFSRHAYRRLSPGDRGAARSCLCPPLPRSARPGQLRVPPAAPPPRAGQARELDRAGRPRQGVVAPSRGTSLRPAPQDHLPSWASGDPATARCLAGGDAGTEEVAAVEQGRHVPLLTDERVVRAHVDSRLCWPSGVQPASLTAAPRLGSTSASSSSRCLPVSPPPVRSPRPRPASVEA